MIVLQYADIMMASTRVRSRMDVDLSRMAGSRTLVSSAKLDRRRLFVFSCLLFLLWGHSLEGQSPVATLDDATVAEVIQDSGTRWAPLELSDRGGLFSGAGRGYRIVVYTPKSWIAHLAAQATSAGHALSLAEVDLEDRSPWLRVVASPSAPAMGSSREQSSEVQRVFILDGRRQKRLLPLRARLFNQTHRVILGAVRSLRGIEATFRLAELDALRGGNRGEFFVRVEGARYSKDFKIKRKHFTRLPR